MTVKSWRIRDRGTLLATVNRHRPTGGIEQGIGHGT
jgi:hypothetical protein